MKRTPPESAIRWIELGYFKSAIGLLLKSGDLLSIPTKLYSSSNSSALVYLRVIPSSILISAWVTSWE